MKKFWLRTTLIYAALVTLVLFMSPDCVEAQGVTVREHKGILPDDHPMSITTYTVTPDIRLGFLLWRSQLQATRYVAPPVYTAPTPRRTYTPSYRAPARATAPTSKLADYITLVGYVKGKGVSGKLVRTEFAQKYPSFAACQASPLRRQFAAITWSCQRQRVPR